MSKTESSALTGFENGEASDAERFAHLERDRRPDLERELRARRWRVVRFDVHH